MSVTSVILPKLGLTMDEGTLVAWLKQEGDRIEAGEILFEVETDKATHGGRSRRSPGTFASCSSPPGRWFR